MTLQILIVQLKWKFPWSSAPTLTMTPQWAGSVVDLKRCFIITIMLWDMSCLTPQQTFRQIHHLLQRVFLWFIIIIIISLLSLGLLGKIIWLFKPSGKYLSQFTKPPSIRLWNVQIIFQLIQIIRNKKNLLSARVQRPQNSCHHDWSWSDFNCINVHCTSPSWQLARDDLSYFSSNEYFTMWVPGVAWSLRADCLHKCLDCCCLTDCLSVLA